MEGGGAVAARGFGWRGEGRRGGRLSDGDRLGVRGGGGRRRASPSRRSIRASSARNEPSTSGRAALTSASSRRVRASAPARTASIASPSSSSRRTTVAVCDALGLRGERRVGLGRERQLGGHLAERLHDEQLARAHLEIGGERGRIAALLDALLERPQRRRGVAGGDRVDRRFEQPRVGDAEHREHVLERDRASRCR